MVGGHSIALSVSLLSYFAFYSIIYWVVFAVIACLPVPKRALTLPSEGLGNNYSTSADLLKNLLWEELLLCCFDFWYLMLIASLLLSRKLNLLKKRLGSNSWVIKSFISFIAIFSCSSSEKNFGY